MSPLLLATILVGQAPSPAPAGAALTPDALAWLQLPALSSSWPRVEASAFAGVAKKALDPALRKQVLADGGSLLQAWYDAGAPRLATSAAARRPLESSREVADVVAAYPQVDARFALAVARIYGRIARDPSLGETMRLIQRLGLDKVQQVRGGATLGAKSVVRVEALVSSRAPHRGVLDALGPPVEVTRPVRVPAAAEQALSVSVLPARVFDAVSLVASGLSPVDFTIATTHLAGIEQQLGKRFAADALGGAPRVWTLYSAVDPADRATDHVLVLEVGDVPVTRRFVEAYLDAAERLVRGTKVERSGSGESARYVVRLPNRVEVAIGFAADALILGSRAKAVTNALASTPRARPVLDKTASATLFGGGKGVAAALVDELARRLGQRGVPLSETSELAATLGPEGLSVTAEIRAR